MTLYQPVHSLLVSAAKLHVAHCFNLPVFPDADINDLTIGSIADDLAREGLGPAGLGLATTDTPHFPLQGMLWWTHKRPFFCMIGTRHQRLCAMQRNYLWADRMQRCLKCCSLLTPAFV